MIEHLLFYESVAALDLRDGQLHVALYVFPLTTTSPATVIASSRRLALSFASPAAICDSATRTSTRAFIMAYNVYARLSQGERLLRFRPCLSLTVTEAKRI